MAIFSALRPTQVTLPPLTIAGGEAEAGTAREPDPAVTAEATASGWRAPATRPGGLRDLVEEHLRKFPGAAFTPAPCRQGADPVLRRGRQRPGQARQLWDRGACLR
jgi:hypothetical protein